ncbi:tRNA 4-thiouridine(8) synthase ThiI [Nanoarchaeota archaeon]
MKAVGLFSGGLDSLLAIKLIQKQGFEVIAVSFRSPFFISDEKKKTLEKTAKKHKFKVKFIEFGPEYFKIVKKPKHGHGKNMNPCIDCHAFMLKKAKGYAKKIKAKFVFTGEVLDERPMSQNRGSLRIVEKEAGLTGKLLRPLSAKLLKETEAEKKGFVDRNKLMDIRGRTRKRQFELVKKFKIKEFETPGGGCLLTTEEYSNKLRDLFKNSKTVSVDDIKLLKVGRHFRLGKNKIIVGRNKVDNDILVKQKGLKLEAKDFVGPTTLLQGKPTKKAIELAAKLTARYSDADKDEVIVKYDKKEIIIFKIKNVEKFRIQ